MQGVKNTSPDNSRSLGAAFFRALAGGERSQNEFALVRFVQTPQQRLQQIGTVYALGWSDTAANETGRFSLKIPVGPRFKRDWKKGSAQLAGYSLLLLYGPLVDFESDDYENILSAMEKARINPSLTEKVGRAEKYLSAAREINTSVSSLLLPPT